MGRIRFTGRVRVLLAMMLALLVIAGTWSLAIALAPPPPPEFDEDWVTWITRKQTEDGRPPNDEAHAALLQSSKSWEQIARDWHDWPNEEPPPDLPPLEVVITHGPWPREDALARRATEFIDRARAQGVFDAIRKWRQSHSSLPINMDELHLPAGVDKASRAVQCALRIAGAEGDEEAVVEYVTDLLMLGDAAGAHRLFNGALVSVACDARALGELRYLVVEGRLGAGSIPRLLQLITADTHPTVAEIVEGSHRIFLQTQADEHWFVNARSYREYLRESDIWWREFVASAPTMLTQLDMNSMRFEPVFPGNWSAADGMNYFRFEATMCVRQDLLRSIEHHGTACLLAIELFRANTGRLPKTLDEAADAAGLNAVMRVDVSAGQPFVYRVDPDAPRGYQLYAIGGDGVDNGGRFDVPRRVAMSLTHPKGHGFDFNLLAPRRDVQEK